MPRRACSRCADNGCSAPPRLRPRPQSVEANLESVEQHFLTHRRRLDTARISVGRGGGPMAQLRCRKPGLGRGRVAVWVAVALLAASCGSPATSPPAAVYRLGAFPAVPSNPLPADTATALQAVLDSAVRHGLPGVSATVLVAGRGTWTGVAGMADDEHPVEPSAVFGIASITKTMVAAEIMRLSEAGRLRLDDPSPTTCRPGSISTPTARRSGICCRCAAGSLTRG